MPSLPDSLQDLFAAELAIKDDLIADARAAGHDQLVEHIQAQKLELLQMAQDFIAAAQQLEAARKNDTVSHLPTEPTRAA